MSGGADTGGRPAPGLPGSESGGPPVALILGARNLGGAMLAEFEAVD